MPAKPLLTPVSLPNLRLISAIFVSVSAKLFDIVAHALRFVVGQDSASFLVLPCVPCLF